MTTDRVHVGGGEIEVPSNVYMATYEPGAAKLIWADGRVETVSGDDQLIINLTAGSPMPQIKLLPGRLKLEPINHVA